MYNISLIHWLSPMNFLDGQGHVKNIMGKLKKKKPYLGPETFLRVKESRGEEGSNSTYNHT